MADYEILEQIGKGLRGTVFKGLDVRNKREVAIKKVYSSRNTVKEIQNHLALNNLNIIPALYDYFDKDGITYIVQQLIHGDGLFNAWRNNQNWDFIWMTVYHALKIIDEFHNYGYYHGDLHSNNLIWSGDKMWIIDFDKMVNVSERIKELEDQRIKIERDLPLNYLEVYDYDPFDEIDNELYNLRKGTGFCEDYVDILSDVRFVKLGDYKSFTNINRGYEKYLMLIDYYRNNKCVDYNNFSNTILSQYNLIDNT